MPVLLREGTVPHLIATWRKRPCARCGARAHVTLFSPSTFMSKNVLAGLRQAFGGEDAAGSDGQCCIRCTRALRS